MQNWQFILENRQLIFHNFALMKKYLDNASTTAIRAEVIQEMTKVMAEDFWNPSSTHSFGRNAKVFWNFPENQSPSNWMLWRKK
jgi:hypothetical protein